MALDTGGNVKVDYVWGNFPMQPNDIRTETAASNIGGSTGDYGWAATTAVTGARLDAALDSHAIAEAGWSGYPAYTAGTGNYIITAVTGDGSDAVFTSQNKLAVGDAITVSGLTEASLNDTGTVTAVTAVSFTTESGFAGTITGQSGKVQLTNALTAADGAGIGYINVPSVVGDTTAVALDELKDAGYEAANITTAAAAANPVSTITAVARTGTTATITSTGAGAKYPVGTKITVASLVAPDTALNGTFTVTAVATNTVSYTTTTSGTLSTGSLSVAGLSGVAGTIKTQSVAAGTASVLSTATITITPHATVS